jgi:hypothetical protein
MASKKTFLIIFGGLTIAAVASALAITITVMQKCNFMIGYSQNCTFAGSDFCCPCCDNTRP